MVTAKDKVTEQVQGLQQAPEDGKFVVRKVKGEASVDANGNATPEYTHELVLVVKGEGEYSTPLFGFDDNVISSTTYTLTQKRRTELRKTLFEANDEVELTQ